LVISGNHKNKLNMTMPNKPTKKVAKKDVAPKFPSPAKASASSLKLIDTQSIQKRRAVMKFQCARIMHSNCVFICVQDGSNPVRDAYLHGIHEEVRRSSEELAHLNFKAVVCLRNGPLQDTPARNPNGFNRRGLLQINDEPPSDEECVATMEELCRVRSNITLSTTCYFDI
jgi:hypothetical protein